MDQQFEQSQDPGEQLPGDVILGERAGFALIKGKVQRIITAWVGSAIAIVVVLTIFRDALGLARAFFSTF